MPKILVPLYSAYDHISTMAEAVAEGAHEAGTTVMLRRARKLMDKASMLKAEVRPDEMSVVFI